MKPITYPLNPNDKGENVANLQDALQFLVQQALAGVAPAGFHPQESPDSPTREELTDLLKRLSIEREQSVYGEATQRLVFYFQLQNNLGDNLRGKVDELTAAKMNKLLKELGALEEEPSYVVYGIVADSNGKPVAGLMVRAYDKDLRKEQYLGTEATTDKNGKYEIRYSREQFTRAEKDNADLIVRVYERDGSPDKPLTESPINFNAPAVAEINLVLPQAAEEPSEFERYTQTLLPLITGQDVKVTDLDDKDIDFLAGETGIERQHIAWLVQAVKLSIDSSGEPSENMRSSTWAADVNLIPVEAFYGWFRDGQPQQFRELIKLSTDLLMASLENAVRQRYIPALKPSLVEKLKRTIDSQHIAEALKPAGEGEPASLGDMLRTLPIKLALDSNQQTAVAKVLQEDLTPEINLVERLQDVGIKEKQAWGIERALNLQNLTLGYVPLMQALQMDDVDSASASLHDLARYDTKDWHELVGKHGVPANIQGADEAQRQKLYADQLAATIEDLFPSEWIAFRIEHDRFPVNNAVKSDLQMFFKQNPQFQVGKTSVLRYFDDLETVNLEGVTDVEGVREEMLKIERIVNCSPRLEIASKVLGEGYVSAHAIALNSHDRFIETITAENPAIEKQVDEVYQRAVQVNAKAVAIATEYIRAERSTPLAIMQPRSQTNIMPLIAARNSQTADLRTLFGNLDFCECEHCSSVYSPAAYLVDLMQMLDGGIKNGRNQSPLDVLFERRPDLAEIDLTCENTNTTIPYIDLVLEALEGAFDNKLSMMRVGPRDDDALDHQILPAAIRADINSWGISLTDKTTVSPLPQDSNGRARWLLRDQGWKVHLQDYGNSNGYKILVWPQTYGNSEELKAVPNFVFPLPYYSMRTSAFPWSLPFDLWREETNIWLSQLRVERHALMATFAGNDRYLDFNTAIEFLGLSKAEADKLTIPVYGWTVWGFDSNSAITTPIKDPIGGGSFTPGGSDNTWVGVLSQRASLLRHRAGLTQRELMNLLETNFIQEAVSPKKLQLTGDECDASKMSITNLNEIALKCIHLFVRLWRKLGWSMPDLDRAIQAFPQAVNTTNGALKPECLVFLANLERLRKKTGLPLGILVSWYTSKLSTQQYADFSRSQPRILPSTYEELFYDRSVARPKDAAFELNSNRDELLPSNSLETVRSKISVIAAALATKTGQIEVLLPPIKDSLSLAEFTGPIKGAGIDRRGTNRPIFELDLRQVRGTNPVITLRLQHADLPADANVNPQFTDIPQADLNNVQQPAEITDQTKVGLQRFFYTGDKPLLRIAITAITGTVSLAGRIVLKPVVSDITDELTLSNLSALNRYTSLTRALRLATQDLLLAIDLTGIQVFDVPENTLILMDLLQLIPSMGFLLADIDYLLRHRSLEQSKLALADSKAASILTAIRQGLQQIQQDTALRLDEQGEITRKWLAYLQWPNKLIDELLGPDFLWRGRIETAYDANHLPSGINLPASMKYDREIRKLSILGRTKNKVLTDLNNLLIAARNTDLVPAVERLMTQIQKIQDAPFHAVTIYEGIHFPAGVNLPAALKYDDAAKNIIVADKITETELNALKSPTTGQDFDQAIDRLIDQVRTAADVVEGISKRMHSYVLPLHTVPLAQMPVTVPQNWSGCFFFQPATPMAGAKLAFVGFMTEVAKKALVQLAPNNNAYTDAIEQLYQSSILVPANAEFINQSIAEQLVFEKQTPQDRFAIVLGELLPYLRKQFQNNLLIEKISAAFGVEDVLTERLLVKLQYPIDNQPQPLAQTLLASNYANSDAKVVLTRNGFEQQFNALDLLYKAGVIISRLGFQNKQVEWLFDGTWQGLPNLSELPLAPITGNGQFAQWVNLAKLTQLPKSLPGGEQTLEKIANLLNQNPPPVWNSDFQNAVADSLNWAQSDFKLLLGSNGLDFTSIDDFRQSQNLIQLADCLTLILKLGSTAEMAINWKKAELTAQDAMAARQLVRARYDQATWYQLAQPLQNKLRQKRRTTLLDFLIAQEGVRDANDLFGKYLIDPEMGDCMMTTRILQTASAVQLFIHRCFMGLEPEVPAKAINKDRWQWMKNYRVWEANRKVFFYPENWIEPELRDDKSPFFQELESELLQGDITSEKAESALRNYLAKLDEVSRLEVVGMYRDTPRNSDGQFAYGFETLHVFGRTYTDPRKYFYRSYHKLGFAPTEGFWTAWQPVDLDIEGGDLLYPVVWEKRPYLFWLTLSEKADETIPANNQATKPDKYWQITLNWSVYENGKWQPRKIYPIDLGHKIRTSIAKSSFVLMGQNNLTAIRHGLIAPAPSGNVIMTQKLKQLNINGYSIDTENDSNFDVIPTTLNLSPILLLYDDNFLSYLAFGKVKLGINMEGKIFDTPKILKRIVYAHQELRNNFIFRAPLRLPPEFIGISGGGPINLFMQALRISVGEVSHFILSDPQKHSFFGYPYWKTDNGKSGLNFLLSATPLIQFTAFYHPQTQQFQQTLRELGVNGFLQLDMQKITPALNEFSALKPNKDAIPEETWPNLDVDFSYPGAYSHYNWELFFHVPFIVATHLAKNQRFEEARQWFHYVFDPTDASPGTEPARFWRFRPFHENAVTTPIQRLAQILADPHNNLQEKQEFDLQVRQWLENPFKPHAVARWRNRAYMFSVVMKYLDNLIAWGDQLFRRDTRESLNEALQIYVLAAQILGRKPESVPRRTRPQIQSYSDIRGKLDRLSNILVAAENVLPPSNSPGQVRTALPAMPSLLFCVPENPKIMEYYDKVADRLFKLRNCMNIDGVVRQLPLFDPPIDPAILVKAAAAGIDLSSVLSDLNAPLPLYHFNIMAQKATELCAEVKSLGSALLSAVEKRDSEAMALLRSQHEISLLQQQRQVKEIQVEEAKANIEALAQSLEAAKTKLAYYTGLISTMEDLTIPTGPAGPQAINLINAALDTAGKTAVVLAAVTSVIDPVGLAGALLLNNALTRTTEDLSSLLAPPSGNTNKVPMIPAEKSQLEELKQSHDLQQKVKDYQEVAQIMSMIPDITLGTQGAASSPVVQAQIGGTLLSKIAQLQGSFIEYESSEHAYRANLHSILAGYQRRAAEWLHQAQLAQIDIEQITKQGLAAALRLKITSDELLLHDQQIENAQSVEEFMRSKYTNQELYDWMVGQISSTYFQSYQLAYDVAKRAEKAYRFELGLQDSDTNYIQFGYWDSMKKGLLAAEKLYHDLKRMEVAYIERNRREFELTKHISLAMIDPLALVKLRETGQCFFRLPEEIFDLDYPGHYFRRIKSVSITLPCVVGPYTTLSCTLRLLKSSVRVSTTNGNNGYPRNTDDQGLPADDSRFVENNIPVKAIAASHAQNDSGMFELNFRDERYLPFEGAGVVSEWSLELFSDAGNADSGKSLRQFDYNTISDAILHVKYTAREDAGSFKNAAIAHLREYFHKDGATPSLRMFNLRQEFPTQWHRFLNPTNPADGNLFKLELSSSLFPFRDSGKTLKVNTICLLARCKNAGEYKVVMTPPLPEPPPDESDTILLIPVNQYGGLHFGQKGDDADPLEIVVELKDQPVQWQIKMTRPGEGNLQKDEVEELSLVLGYEWQ